MKNFNICLVDMMALLFTIAWQVILFLGFPLAAIIFWSEQDLQYSFYILILAGVTVLLHFPFIFFFQRILLPEQIKMFLFTIMLSLAIASIFSLLLYDSIFALYHFTIDKYPIDQEYFTLSLLDGILILSILTASLSWLFFLQEYFRLIHVFFLVGSMVFGNFFLLIVYMNMLHIVVIYSIWIITWILGFYILFSVGCKRQKILKTTNVYFDKYRSANAIDIREIDVKEYRILAKAILNISYIEEESKKEKTFYQLISGIDLVEDEENTNISSKK